MSDNSRSYSTEDEQNIEQVFSASGNYYDLFSVDQHSRNFDSELKESWHGLCRKVHPDKNCHPRADEAFKVVNEAFNTLQEQSKRYDYNNRERIAEEEERQREADVRLAKEFQTRDSNKKLMVYLFMILLGTRIVLTLLPSDDILPIKRNEEFQDDEIQMKDIAPKRKPVDELDFVVHLESDKVFQQKCRTRFKKFCVLAFLPNLKACDVDCHQTTLKLLASLSKKYYHLSWEWMWTHYGAQPDFEERIFNSPPNEQQPSLVVMSLKRNKFWILKSENLNVAQIQHFIEIEKGPSYKIPDDGLPQIINSFL